MRSCAALAALVAAFAGLVAAGAPAADAPTLLEQADRTRYAEPPHLLADFALQDQEARSVKFSSLRGQTLLVFFGFTNCPNVCPPTLQKLRQSQRALDQDKLPVTAVFISVDGERDTPAVMNSYLQPFGSGFIGLTGDPKVVRDIATEFSAVFFKGMPTDTKGGYNVEHTSQVYLVDRDGRLRATFYNASASDMVAVARDIARVP